MSCPQTDNTLLWLYGEGSEDHVVHIVDCEPCTALVAEHEEVAAAIAPVVSQLSGTGAPEAPILRAPFRTRTWAGAVGALALAAAVLLVARPELLPSTAEHGTPVDTDVLVAVAADPRPGVTLAFDSELDLGLDTLDFELDSMSRDLSTL